MLLLTEGVASRLIRMLRMGLDSPHHKLQYLIEIEFVCTNTTSAGICLSRFSLWRLDRCQGGDLQAATGMIRAALSAVASSETTVFSEMLNGS